MTGSLVGNSAGVAATAPRTIRLLCADDSEDDIDLIRLALKRADSLHSYAVTAVDEAARFTEALGKGVDVVLCDYNMPRFSPREALALLAAHAPGIPLVVVTHAIGEDAIVSLMRDGAKDYVGKDKLATLPQVIARVMADRQRQIHDAQLKSKLEAAHARLRDISSRALAAQDLERSLISRELHDVLGQTLTAAVIHLHASRNSKDPAAANGYVDQALQMVKTAIGQVKTLSFSLRPAPLDLLGLVAAVHADVHRLADPAGLQVRITTRGNEPAALGDGALVAVRVIREAVTNAIRHADATQLAVRLRFTPAGHIEVLVADNGVGFDAATVLGETLGEHNLGLYGMIERVELVGGRLRLRTQPGSGVIVKAIL